MERLYHRFFSEETKEKSERAIIFIAIAAFILHLLIIAMVELGFIRLNQPPDLLTDPIAAIYTPFSFILIYEVYLLIYYIPKSISNYISKQYEIITLIVIRRIFKDLSNLEFNEQWFENSYDLQFTYDVITTILLFLLVGFFYKLRLTASLKTAAKEVTVNSQLAKFIHQKKWIAVLLIPVFIGLAFYSLGNWIYHSMGFESWKLNPVTDVNKIFFNEFFTVLILTDVLLLLLSYFNSDQWHKIIRNSGFIISTILIRLSFGSFGLINNVLIVVAVLFGVIILFIHNQFDKLEAKRSGKS